MNNKKKPQGVLKQFVKLLVNEIRRTEKKKQIVDLRDKETKIDPFFSIAI